MRKYKNVQYTYDDIITKLLYDWPITVFLIKNCDHYK